MRSLTVSRGRRGCFIVGIITLFTTSGLGVRLSNVPFHIERIKESLCRIRPTVFGKTPRVNQTSDGVVFHAQQGRLGNQLFQWASISNIATENGMRSCITGGELEDFFEGVKDRCVEPFPWQCVVEDGYGKWQQFQLQHTDTVIVGSLQSYKYFDPSLREHMKFKPHLSNHAQLFLETLQHKVLVGIHMRRYEASHLRTPSQGYFEHAMDMFTRRYNDVGFVVVCEDIEWCANQPQFQRENIHISSEKRHYAVDMAILAACDHIILSVGTFGWWAAFIGPDSRLGGVVVYYDSEFVADAQGNVGMLQLEDYYPPHWIAVGDKHQHDVIPI
jgi:galactoside 2-L-fucosyltransferase 1/2